MRKGYPYPLPLPLPLALPLALPLPLPQVRQEPEAVVSLYEAAVSSKVKVPRHEMHGVVYAHIEMQQPIKAFQQVSEPEPQPQPQPEPEPQPDPPP